jgi:hypothetical protein
MSYCRWSSDNWMCDLYCYEHVNGGWTTHVAGRKRTHEPPDDRFDDFVAGKITAEEFTELHNATMDALGEIPLEPIDLPHAGETFSDPTLEDFRDRVLSLKALGYHVPDYVISVIDDEIKEAAR